MQLTAQRREYNYGDCLMSSEAGVLSLVHVLGYLGNHRLYLETITVKDTSMQVEKTTVFSRAIDGYERISEEEYLKVRKQITITSNAIRDRFQGR